MATLQPRAGTEAHQWHHRCTGEQPHSISTLVPCMINQHHRGCDISMADTQTGPDMLT